MTSEQLFSGGSWRGLARGLAVFWVFGGHAMATTTAHSAKTHHSTSGTRTIAKFGDWRVAAHGQGASLVCYAYTRASKSAVLPGRGEVALTVTERPALRDSVAISAGFLLTTRGDVKLQVGNGTTLFYPGGRLVFARQGPAAIAMLGGGTSAELTLPSPKDGDLQDTFSLNGFTAALDAARKACPVETYK